MTINFGMKIKKMGYLVTVDGDAKRFRHFGKPCKDLS